MDAIESQYWDIKTTNAEIEQEALTLKRDFWNLKLKALKDEITKGSNIEPKQRK